MMEITLYNCQVFVACNVMIASEIGMNAAQTMPSSLSKIEIERGGET